MKVDPSVIAEPATYHWRDAASKPLCRKTITAALIVKFSKRDGRKLCANCRTVAREIEQGFPLRKESNDRHNEPDGTVGDHGGTLRLLEA